MHDVLAGVRIDGYRTGHQCGNGQGSDQSFHRLASSAELLVMVRTRGPLVGSESGWIGADQLRVRQAPEGVAGPGAAVALVLAWA